MKLSQTQGRKKARLEIIPLIDIMFFLVATFMMVSLSMIKNQGVEVNLPISSSSVAIERSQSATISITKDEEIYFNKDKVDMDQLRQNAREFRTEHPDGPILLNCDREARMNKVMDVLDALRHLGITNVALQTEAASGS